MAGDRNNEGNPYTWWYDYCAEHRIDVITYYDGYICDQISFNLVFADNDDCPRGEIFPDFKTVDLTPWIK